MDEMRADAQRELLGLAACAALGAFEELAGASRLAGTTQQRLDLATLAARQLDGLGQVRRRIEEAGGSARDAMTPFIQPVDAFAGHTRAGIWCEAVVKIAVMGALARDFVAGVAGHLDPELASLLAGLASGCAPQGPGEKAPEGATGDKEPRDPAGEMVLQAIAAEPLLRDRMALFGRRLLGETLGQAQRVAAAHPGLTGLLTGGGDDADDLAAISELMARLASAHARRMSELTLA